jgi:hypothetical protein
LGKTLTKLLLLDNSNLNLFIAEQLSKIVFPMFTRQVLNSSSRGSHFWLGSARSPELTNHRRVAQRIPDIMTFLTINS